MEGQNDEAEGPKQESPPVLVKRRFYANDPLIVAGPKRGNKKTKLDFPKKETRKKAQQEEKHIAKHVGKEDDTQQEGRIAHARTYQMIILAKALEENTIVFLETGCGKTLISILLIKELASSFRAKKEKFLAVFMAPTVCLVQQQRSVLSINLDLRVDCFYGAKGVDYWSEAMWKEQVNDNEVLVMTPMVFLEALRHGFLKLEQFQLLIFDECHQAQKQHPYAKIMREFYHELKSEKPRIFGMTASPVTSKGVTSTEDSAKQMQQLEHLLDAKVYTLEDKTELEQFVPTPVQTIKWFSPSDNSFEFVLQELSSIRRKYELTYNASLVSTDGYKDVEELAKKLWKKIKKLHGCLQYSLEELGLWCAYESANCILKKISTDLKYGEEAEDKEVQSSKETFLRESSEALNTVLQRTAFPISSIEDGLLAVEKGLLTSKVLVLVNCLLEYKDVENLRCIVFVERVVTAMVLAKVLGQIGCLSFLRCSFLAGTTASLDVMRKKQQSSTLAEFHSGKINVLVATDVAEEGLDVQRCRSVIRFDLSKTVRSYIQSRGRARMPGSDYIIFLEKENKKQQDQLSDLMQSEESMRGQAVKRTHYSVLVDKVRVEDMEVFHVEKTGATVSTDSSISLVTRFCSNLPGDKYYKPQPEFAYEKIGDESNHVCKLILPPNGPFRELIGPVKRSRNLAKQAVCLEACKKLHAMGQLTDHLIPVVDVEKSEEEEVMNLSGKNVAGAGTNKRKELHSTTSTDYLSGGWINSSEDVVLHAYIICFQFCQKEEDEYVDFVLLLKAAIDDDVANTEFPIHLSNGRKATAKFFDAGTYALSVDQLKDAKAYHQLIFNGMFGKLLKRLNKPDGPALMKNVLASQSALNDMWSPLQMYLVLPLIPGKLAEETEEIPIDWKAIRHTAMTVSIFSFLCATQGSGKGYSSSESPDKRKATHDKRMLQMARGWEPVSKLKGMAVVTIHTGRVYSVIDVLEDKNATCPIEGAQDSIYSSYSQYFTEKYKKVIENPEQPLLQVKQSHRIHNLLTQDMAVTKKQKNSTETVGKTNFVELPPELCLCTGVSNAVIRTLYLFPSVFHRFNALLSASQLRSGIAKAMPQCMSIQGTVMMQALTTLRCLEGFSFEGLELLGDSFLKYAVSRYLYLVYDKKHEGQLSNRRSRVICNEKLHHLAIAKQLPGYIRDEPFQPDFWTAPGLLSIKSVKCKCNLDNLVYLGKSYDRGEEQLGSVFRIGKTCSKGHRWICSKTVSDAVEALIGAYISSGDAGPALGFMKWIGMDIDFDLSLYKHARDRCNVHPRVLNGVNIAGLEAQLDYVFWNKGLLVEALTHASQQDPYEERGCYQRLEFLGDAVLDFLITRHLFLAHPGLSPGVLSDLRSAAVNNECFARSAVRHNLQRYLRHGSGELLSQITGFVKAVEADSEATSHSQSFGWEGVHGPKVLGDLVESIAGAILVDSGFDLERVWSVMERILSPLVTPSTLPLHPIRELHELSQSKGFSFVWKKTQNSGKLSIVTGEVEVGDEVISATAMGQLKKTARKDAAQKILNALKSRGIRHPRWQVADQNASVKTPVKVIQANEKRGFDGDAGGSAEKRQRLSCVKDETFGDAGLNSSEVKLMGGLAPDEPGPVDEGSKELSSNESSIKARMSDSPENVRNFIKADVSQQDRKSCMDLGENKSDMDHSVPEHDLVATVDEHATSINLKMSPSKSDDETTSVCCDDTSSMPQPLLQLQSNSEMIKKQPDTRALFTALRLKGVGVGDSSDYSIKKITEKGCGRAKLNEFCITNKWAAPIYELVRQDGLAHAEKFIFSASVNTPCGPIKYMSEPMSRKSQAKDDAAVNVLLALDRKFSA